MQQAKLINNHEKTKSGLQIHQGRFAEIDPVGVQRQGARFLQKRSDQYRRVAQSRQGKHDPLASRRATRRIPRGVRVLPRQQLSHRGFWSRRVHTRKQSFSTASSRRQAMVDSDRRSDRKETGVRSVLPQRGSVRTRLQHLQHALSCLWTLQDPRVQRVYVQDDPWRSTGLRVLSDARRVFGSPIVADVFQNLSRRVDNLQSGRLPRDHIRVTK